MKKTYINPKICIDKMEIMQFTMTSPSDTQDLSNDTEAATTTVGGVRIVSSMESKSLWDDWEDQ